MKFYNIGVLVYNNTNNLGDWYQTAAALYIWWCYFEKPNTFMIFLKRIINESKMGDYDVSWVNRDKLSKTKKPNNNKKIILICNAWWMLPSNNKLDFPPPEYIIPIYTSMHINNPTILLNSEAVNHLKLFEPIGCRDLSTVDLLTKYNINTYFSGCLTITLNLNDPLLGFTQVNNYKNKAVIIDIPKENPSDNSIYLTRCIKDNGDKNYIIHSIQSTYDLMYAESIKTDRLHVWLPMISNNIPCILINKITNDIFKEGDIDQGSRPPINRFSGLINLCNSSIFNEFKLKLTNDVIQKINNILNTYVLKQP